METRYSRTDLLIGQQIRGKLESRKILAIGLNGLGIEIIKNMLLNCSLTIDVYDPQKINLSDLQRCFIYHKHQIGLSRQEVTIQALPILNTCCKVGLFQDVVMSCQTLDQFTEGYDIVFLSDMNAFREFQNQFQLFFEDQTLLESLQILSQTFLRHQTQVVLCESLGCFGYVYHPRLGLITEFVSSLEERENELFENGQDEITCRTLIKALVDHRKNQDEPFPTLDEAVVGYEISNLSKFFEIELLPISSMLGAFAAYSVIQTLKHQNNEGQNVQQWTFVKQTDLITALAPQDPTKIHSLFIPVLQKQLESLKVFIPGVGGLGCELIKNFALLGIGSRQNNGGVYLTDYDNIERSNLNRQLLFTDQDIKQNKSITAKKRGEKLGRGETQIFAFDKKLNESSENIFNDQFWSQIEIVVNGLDRIDARKYTQQKCIEYNIPFFDLGIGNLFSARFQPFIPQKTLSYFEEAKAYSDSQWDSVNSCTVKSYPTNINHCLQWSQEMFVTYFSNYLKTLYQEETLTQEELTKLKQEKPSLAEKLERIQYQILLQDVISDKITLEERKIALMEFMFRFYRTHFIDPVEKILESHPESEKTFWQGLNCPIPGILEDQLSLLRTLFTNMATIICQIALEDEIQRQQILEIIEKECQNYNIEEFSNQIEQQELIQNKSEADFQENENPYGQLLKFYQEKLLIKNQCKFLFELGRDLNSKEQRM